MATPGRDLNGALLNAEADPITHDHDRRSTAQDGPGRVPKSRERLLYLRRLIPEEGLRASYALGQPHDAAGVCLVEAVAYDLWRTGKDDCL